MVRETEIVKEICVVETEISIKEDGDMETMFPARIRDADRIRYTFNI